jgi:hypothetical protein
VLTRFTLTFIVDVETSMVTVEGFVSVDRSRKRVRILGTETRPHSEKTPQERFVNAMFVRAK